MIIELRFDAQRPRAWMARTVALAGDGHDVRIKWITTRASRPAGLEALFTLERMVLRKGRHCGADATDRDAIGGPPSGDDKPDVVVDFTVVAADPTAATRYLRPLYNGAAGEDAALAAVVAGDLPRIDIRDDIGDAIVASGRPSAEAAEGLSGALDTVMARTMTLLRAALSGKPRYLIPNAEDGKISHGRSPAAYVIRGLAGEIARRIYRLCCYAPHWHVGWRYTNDAGVWASGNLSGAPWAIIADPGHRFYADPFPITWQGRTFVFFEDLDHRVGKGIISAIEFDSAGPKGPVIPVLDEPWHLSYPFLIEHDGALWMIPESSLNGDVAIYRCTDFPGKWERHATLLSGLELGDATIVRHDRLYYLFGASRDGGGGYSDTLSIFYAEQLFGPWLPHPGNPIMVDRSCARPAGSFMPIDGKLWRPVQDCSNGYGAALGLAEVNRLSPTTFRQTVHHKIAPGPLWPGRKLHTLNRSGRLEVIDGSRIQPKLAALRPPVSKAP